MKYKILTASLFLIVVQHVFAQADATSFVKAFKMLHRSKVEKAISFDDIVSPKLIVMYSQGQHTRVVMMSLENDRPRILWKLKNLPDFMAVHDSSDLKVIRTNNGPVIELHGCARHLCGGDGVAGAFTYSVDTRQFCTAMANTIKNKDSVTFSYGPPGVEERCRGSRPLLNQLLRKEGYSPSNAAHVQAAP